MTDRELLEMAAKAAGYEPQGWEDGKLYLFGVQDGWNPLTDDGDALRLAVRLDITVMQPAPEDRGSVLALWPRGQGVSEPRGQDKCAATRRAIVRAAAEIGKAMQ